MTSLTQVKSPVWHPFTQMKTAAPPLMVKKGEGVFIELEDGRRIIDCISSWWVNIHGHSNPEIAKAIYEQALTLEHVIFAGFTHAPAENLAKRLLTHLPPSLNKIFYSDNGSTAVEVALKMAIQYWHNSGQARTKLIAFDGGYHGDTLGSMSVGKTAPFWEPFKSMMCSVDTASYPATWENDEEVIAKEKESLDSLRLLIESNPSTYAAIIIEPLIQGAGGMKFCRSEFLKSLRALANELDVLLIYDEVMTGFGRTGDWFASIKSQTTPDIICLSKGITGGFLPLAVTVTSEKVFDGFYSDDVSKTFFHGHSYTANPLACAAALASMDILERTSDSFLNAEIENRQATSQFLNSKQQIEHLRFCGTIIACEVTTSSGNNYFNQIGPVLKQKFLDRGFLIRPLGNTLYLMPPYCLTNEQRLSVFAGIAAVLEEIA